MKQLVVTSRPCVAATSAGVRVVPEFDVQRGVNLRSSLVSVHMAVAEESGKFCAFFFFFFVKQRHSRAGNVSTQVFIASSVIRDLVSSDVFAGPISYELTRILGIVYTDRKYDVQPLFM